MVSWTEQDWTAARREIAARTEELLVHGEWEQYLRAHGPRTCLDALRRVARDRRFQVEPPELYWRLVEDCWHDAGAFADARTWVELLSDPRPGREAIMDEQERALLAALPDELFVYRGVGNGAHIAGLSWTLHRGVAAWFAWTAGMRARRAGLDPLPCVPLVVTGRLRRVDVIAYLNGRNEAELVAFPDSVTIVSTAQLA